MNSVHNYLKAIMIAAACLCIGTFVFGQTDDYNHYAEILVNTNYSSPEYPGQSIIAVSGPYHGSYSEIQSGPNVSVSYLPDSNYLGLDEMLLEVRSGFGPFMEIRYVFIQLSIQASSIVTVEDYYTVDTDSDFQYFDVQANDSTSVGYLSLHSIPALHGGEVLVSNDSLYFKPLAGYQGMSYLTYNVCDSFNLCRQEVVNICVVDADPASDYTLVRLSTGENQMLTDFLPSSNYSIGDAPLFGDLELISGSDAFSYLPFISEGIDSFTLVDGNAVRQYIIQVVDREDANSFLVDDHVSLLPGDTVIFDVKENDRRQSFFLDGFTMPDQGNLIQISDGVFRYVADSTFFGTTSFEYEICVFGFCETAEVIITLSEFQPENDQRYEFSTLKNTPHLIKYDIPISDYEFVLSVSPLYGTVDIYNGLDTLDVGCEESIGRNMVLYNPGTDFTGIDKFELEYCVNGHCEIIKFDVEVLDLESPDSCACVTNCVWPGDIDFDGQVDMKDVLFLGLNIGEIGAERPNPDLVHWYGQYSPDWHAMMAGTHKDRKHADTDGDGLVTVLDTSAISSFYKRQHNIVAKPLSTVKPYDIGIELDLDSLPTIGDTITLFITVGSESAPISEMHGLEMSFSFDPDMVDTSYIKTKAVNNNWLTRTGVPLFMNRKAGPNIDMALSRIDGNAYSGHGRVFAVDIVIEDDLDGLRPDRNNHIPISFDLHSISALGDKGQVFDIPSRRLSIYAKLPVSNEVTADKTLKLSVIPNPFVDYLDIDTDGVLIHEIGIHDMSGKRIRHIQSVAHDQVRMKLDNLQTGLYIIYATTEKGVYRSTIMKAN
jgi:hypothetical protein